MAIKTPEDLRRHLEWAVQIELSTIPLYLFAMYSLKDQRSDAVALIRSVVVEEMLHVSLAANLLLSVGGTPRFYDSRRMPSFPGPIPHHRAGFEVSLAPCSVELVRDVFMHIELPGDADAPPEDDNFDTIGQYYLALELAFQDLDRNHSLFEFCQREKQLGDPKYYCPVGFDADDSGGLLVVEDLRSAHTAIQYIIHQGEGIRSDHYADPDRQELAHYYKFENLTNGTTPLGAAWPLAENPKVDQMGPVARDLAVLFNACYGWALLTMDEIFSTVDEARKEASTERLYCIMKDILPPVARELVAQPLRDGSTQHAGPTFEFHEFATDTEVAVQIRELVDAARRHVPDALALGEVGERVSALRMPLEPSVNPTVNGPYSVMGLHQLENSKGERLPARVSMNLCRCGGSGNKPFCDGTHARIGFRSEKPTNPLPDRRDHYPAGEITIHDNRRICAHAGLCSDNLKEVFRVRQEPWIVAGAAPVERVIEVVEKCPSGALSYSHGGREHRDREGPPRITVSKDGPYWVSGALQLQGAQWGEGASREHYTLCRCGHSKNKPYCDGSHWGAGFSDDKN